MIENPIIEFLIQELTKLQKDLKEKYLLPSIYQVDEGIFTFAWSDNVNMLIYTVEGLKSIYRGYPHLDGMEPEARTFVTKRLTKIIDKLTEMVNQ